MATQFLLWPRSPIQYGRRNAGICLKFYLKFGVHGILRQNETNHQILMRISIVSTKRHSCQHIVVNLGILLSTKIQYGGRQTGSSFESVNQQCNIKVQENFTHNLRCLVAGIIVEHIIHNGACEIQNGRLKTGSSNNFACNVGENAISNANTMF
jgi:hypothetical protein